MNENILFAVKLEQFVFLCGLIAAGFPQNSAHNGKSGKRKEFDMPPGRAIVCCRKNMIYEKTSSTLYFIANIIFRIC